MKVVSNSTCIIALLRIEKLQILKDLFGRVFIPEEVYREVRVEGKKGFTEFDKAKFFEIRKIRDRRLFNLLREMMARRPA